MAAALPHVDFIDEDRAVFERPEFADVGDQFRRHNAGEPDVPHPSPSMLERAYERIVETLRGSGAFGVMDWSFVDLAEDLDWAEASLADLHEHSRSVREIMNPLNPLVLFLEGDPRVGILRRVAERGRAWFGAQNLSDEEWLAFIDARVAESRRLQRRVLGTFAAGAWELARIDGGQEKAAVLRQALATLE
jgi:hypothetical protein